MFLGQWKECIDVVENSVEILEIFRTEFDNTQKNVNEFAAHKNLKEFYPDKHVDWDWPEQEKNDMFAQMKNFIGRCNNMFEICECISQFMVKD